MISVIQVRVTPHVRKTVAQRLLVLWPNAYCIDTGRLGPDGLRGHNAIVYREMVDMEAGDSEQCMSLWFHETDIEIGHDEDLRPFIERLRETFA
jgi:hypothetical protein